MGNTAWGGLWAAVIVALLFIIVSPSKDAAARSCGDVTRGALRGPHVPAGPYNDAFILPYENACFVQWPGGNRGAAGREEDARKCRSLPGAEMLEFVPDRGSNFNLCVFRILAAGEGGAIGGGAGASGGDAGSTWSTDQAGTASDRPFPSPKGTRFEATKLLDDIGIDPNAVQSALRGNERVIAFCNRTNERINLALFILDWTPPSHDGWLEKRGWYRIDPGDCREFGFAGQEKGEVYFHARSKSRTWPETGKWGGGWCAREQPFDLKEKWRYAPESALVIFNDKCDAGWFLVDVDPLPFYPGYTVAFE